TAREREGVHLRRVDDVEAVGKDLERLVGTRLAEPRADVVHELREGGEPQELDLVVDLLRDLLPEADLAVDGIEVGMVRMFTRARACERESRDGSHDLRRSTHGHPPEPRAADEAATRLMVRSALGCTTSFGPAASTSSSFWSASSPVKLSPVM